MDYEIWKKPIPWEVYALISIGVFPLGAILQVLETTYTTNASLSVAIPDDDTVPLSTEGTQVLSQAITPASNTNKVLCTVDMWGEGDNATGAYITAALFRGTTCIAVKSVQTIDGVPSVFRNGLCLNFLDSPASASAQTYTVRVGANAGSLRLNGTIAGRKYGGASSATLTVMEVAV